MKSLPVKSRSSHPNTEKYTINWTVIDLLMKIQTFKSNEHLWADDPCTEKVQFF